MCTSRLIYTKNIATKFLHFGVSSDRENSVMAASRLNAMYACAFQVMSLAFHIAVANGKIIM